jgi:hypothetical protein
MKIKAILLTIALFLIVQVTFAQEETVDIECNLSINKTNWIKNSQLTAILTVKNNSDKEVKINLPPRFKLEKEGINNSRIIFGDQYISKEKEEDYIITERRKNGFSYKIRQFFEFSLKVGESKTLEFNLSKLAWNDTLSSILIDFDWYKRIPSGKYNLYYSWGYYVDKDKDTKRLINIFSNKISVKLNSEK